MSTVETSVATIGSFSPSRRVGRFLDGLELALRCLGGIILAVTFVLVMTSVTLRYVFGSGLIWSGLAWIAALGLFFPVFWMVLTSFKHERDAFTETPKLIFKPTLEQYKAVFDGGIGTALLNSAWATIGATWGCRSGSSSAPDSCSRRCS